MFSTLVKISKTLFISAALVAVLFTSVVSKAESTPYMNIAQTATSNVDFSTLVTALIKADLAGVLSGDTKYTVLAPTNAAFAKIPSSTLNSLLLPANKESLVKVLKYHVIQGEAKAAQIVNLSEVETLEGGKIKIAVNDGKVLLNGSSNVTATDIVATNGVIHSIDTVLLPADLDLSALGSTTEVAASTISANSADELVRTGGLTSSIASLISVLASAFVIYNLAKSTKRNQF